MAKRPSVVLPRDVWCQAGADWLDKEVQAGYTYTYIWMANQVGHFMLGFAPVIMANWLGRVVWNCWHHNDIPAPSFPDRYMYGFAVLLAVAWLAKEARDVVVAKKQAAGNAFPVDGSDLWKDAGTAVFFFWSGIIPASLSFYDPGLALLSFMILLPIAIVGPAWYWMSRKLCFQRAQFPFLARLADFTSGFESTRGRIGAGGIEAFVARRDSKTTCDLQHLLIFGAANSGRSTLAVAIGTEYTFKVRRARYMTWTKFLDLNSANTDEDPKRVWPWKDADILLLDDVFGSSIGSTDAIVNVGKEIRSLSGAAIKILAERRVVWVLGPNAGDDGVVDRWLELFSRHLKLARAEFGIVEVTGNYTKPTVPVSSLSGH